MAKIVLILISCFLFLSSCGSKEEKIVFNYRLRPLPLDADYDALLSDVTVPACAVTNPNSCPNIYFFFMETMRDDKYVNEVDTPNIYKFKKESLHSEYSYAAGTATPFSTYSMFFGRPAYERHPAIERGVVNGSLGLRILKEKLNYTIYVFGWPDYFFGLDDTSVSESGMVDPLDVTDLMKDDSAMQLIFGEKTKLIEYGNIPVRKNNNTYGFSGGERDTNVMNLFLNKMSSLKSSGGKFFYTYLYSAHGPFEWPSRVYNHLDGFPVYNNIPYVRNPLEPNVTTLQFDANQDYGWGETEKISIINSYRNAFRGYDIHFKRFLDEIKENIEDYNESIIILVGDHGKNLLEYGNTDHGTTPYQTLARVPIYIKLPNNDSVILQPRVTDITSHMDIFPTVFKYLNVTNYGQALFIGEPIYDKSYSSHIIMKPNKRSAPDLLTLIGKEYKVILKFNFENNDIMNSTGFEILEFRDLHDNVISIAPTKDQAYQKVKRDFSDLFSKIFIL